MADRPPCVEHAILNGPEPDDSMAWVINLSRWLKKEGQLQETAPLQLTRWLNASDSIEDLGDDEILTLCRTGYLSDSEISCHELVQCASFSGGCTSEKCPLYVQPVVPLLDGPTARRVYLSDIPGSYGVDGDGAVKMVKSIANRDGSTRNVFVWISDCMVFIHTETIASNEREFIFEGFGAVDKKKARFVLPAEDLAEAKKFRAALINAFGAANRVGDLNFEIVQQITKNTIVRRRLCAPTWVDDKPHVPGVGLADDIEFKLLNMIPAAVHDGDLDAAMDTLGKLLDIPGPTPILVTAIMGSPIYARWFQNDRFGVGMWGRTGSMKTSVAKKAMCIYGIGYNDDANLLKHGEDAGTSYAKSEVMAAAGFLPEIVDNVKSVNPKDSQRYISLIHMVIEGKSKLQGKKDDGLRNNKKYYCTPIITGEIKPDEASTSARILNLKWVEPKSKDELDYVQRNLIDLPVIGYHWLRFLAVATIDIRDGFETTRTEKTEVFNTKNYTNSGRLATIYSLLRMTWNLLCVSPFAEVFQPRTEKFLKLLDSACEEQGLMVTEETEVAKFMSGIGSILATQPMLIQQQERQMPDEYGKSYFKDVIGRWVGSDLFLVPAPTLAALKRLGVFTQIPTEGSITDALAQAGFLKIDGNRRKIQQRMNDRRPYGWLVRGDKLDGGEDAKEDTKNDINKPNDFKSSSSPRKIQETFQPDLEKNEKISSDNTGDKEDIKIDIDKNREIDSDNKNNILSSSSSYSVLSVSSIDRIRIASIQEFGMCGWVNPRKLAANLKLPLDEVISWLEANYEKTPNGYSQKKYEAEK